MMLLSPNTWLFVESMTSFANAPALIVIPAVASVTATAFLDLLAFVDEHAFSLATTKRPNFLEKKDFQTLFIYSL